MELFVDDLVECHGDVRVRAMMVLWPMEACQHSQSIYCDTLSVSQYDSKVRSDLQLLSRGAIIEQSFLIFANRSPSWVCSVKRQPHGGDRFSFKPILEDRLATMGPAPTVALYQLGIVSADYMARSLNFSSRDRFPRWRLEPTYKLRAPNCLVQHQRTQSRGACVASAHAAVQCAAHTIARCAERANAPHTLHFNGRFCAARANSNDN